MAPIRAVRVRGRHGASRGPGRAFALAGSCSIALALLTGCAAGSAPAPSPTARPCSAGTAGALVDYSALPVGSFTGAVASAGGRAVRMGAGTVAFDDFTPSSGTVDGGVLTPAASGLIGAGVARTVFEVAPGTSSHGADIPTTFPDTNQLSVLRIDGTRTVLHGFTVQGTKQGHLYNGLRVDRVQDLRASDIRVAAIPGGAASPPGETFGINDFRTAGSEWSDVVVDGAGVGASGFGVNSTTDIRICDVISKNNRFGMGFAFWQSSGIRCVDCTAANNGRAGFNFERTTGSNTFVRPVAVGNAFGFRISSDQASAKFRIVDPRLTDGRFTVTLPYRYNGSMNRQKASDITLIVDGKNRQDLLSIHRY